MTETLLNQMVTRATEQFAKRFGGEPEWIAAAPGRVNLIGEHVDYNDGFVLPMAIDRYCVVVAGQGEGDESRLFSSATNEEASVSLAADEAGSANAVQNRGHWSSG